MSTASKLHIPRKIYEEMLQHALSEKPYECCGMLAGLITNNTSVVTHHFPFVNILKSATEFESDPKLMFIAQKTIRSENLTELAVYHSHPTSKPLPSKKDLARNYSEKIINLIISLVEKEPEMRAWWLTDSDYEEAEHQIID